MTAEPFNSRRARAKRPCPLWIDAFLRDTMHLGADEVGAYLLILMAMWMRESCDLPDDDRRLAKVCRVSLRLWQSRIGPAIRPYFSTAGDALVSKRLRQEAEYVERQLLGQSNRKTGLDTEWEAYALPEGTHDDPQKDDENSGNILTNNETNPSADATAVSPPIHPSYNPTTQPKSSGGGGSPARDRDDHEAVLVAAGIDPSKDVTGRWWSSAQIATVDRWRAAGFSQADILAEVSNTVIGRPPPKTLAYFDPVFERALAARSAPPLQPSPQPPAIAGDARYDRPPARRTRIEADVDAWIAGASRAP